MMKLGLAVTVAVLTWSVAAVAGYQTCGGTPVPSSTRTCPDGAIPMYHAGQVQAQNPGVQPRSPSAPSNPAAIEDLLGVWHTAVPGGAWQSPSSVPGYNLLHVSPGVRSGDLTIDPSGKFVWNSYGGKVGRWEPGDADYPIVLVDTTEHRRWRVGPDRRHPGKIFIWDGTFTYTGNR